MIWLVTFMLVCALAGCVAILGDGNTVIQHGIELDTDIGDNETIEVENNDGPIKSKDN